MKNLVVFAACTLISAAPAAHAEDAPRLILGRESPAQRYATGLVMEHKKDEKGAFVAFLEAAEDGYPPAQRRLGEIYDSGNSAVKRDYEESIRWYQKAREGGEQIPAPRSAVPSLNSP